MLDALVERGADTLSQSMLNGYIGCQAVLSHHVTRDKLVGGRIRSIILISGSIEIECDWIAHQPFDKIDWKLDDRSDGFLVVLLKHGWRRLPNGGLEILGGNGNMALLPRGEKLITIKDVRKARD